MSESEHDLLEKHGIERLELSVMHAQDWMKYYVEQGPVERYHQWSDTYEFRKNLLEAAIKNAAQTENSHINKNDATTT